MKKRIQKYLSGSNEGFSLVELIIVIAIMAILVGVVALAVIPNLEKSRESKDLTTLDSLVSGVTTALANDPSLTSGSKSKGSLTISAVNSNASSSSLEKAVFEQLGDLSATKMVSSASKGEVPKVEYDMSTGKGIVRAYVGTDATSAYECKYTKGDDGNLKKLIVSNGSESQ